METINFAIDLGTTNSLIAKYNNGKVELFNSLIGLKQNLPSCVAFRGERIIVGDKALELLEKDAQNVCMLFKRKMGTDEVYEIPTLNKNVSPVELSSLILKELKHFNTGASNFKSVVITIPASFDTIQSNATKKAGYLAGFLEVVLLQEPIAASLAFANKANLDIDEQKKWLIYDFGGGTFDVALIQIDSSEIDVLDNEGDNFLGGADFDSLIVEKIIIPKLEQKLQVENLWFDIKQKHTIYKGLYFELLKHAEEVKKELSIKEIAEIELDITINTSDLYELITVSRLEFEALIEPTINKTIDLIKTVIKRNSLNATEIERIVLIGGSTYIPLVREKVKKEIGVDIDFSINPTIAVVEGAAFYAGSKPKKIIEEVAEEVIENNEFEIAFFYEQNTKDLEELISAKIEGNKVKSYRILRLDGGYDSSIVNLSNNAFSEFVPLLKGQLNLFKIDLLDADLNVLKSISSVKINNGTYNIKGQPLPNTICMEIDDVDVSSTRLESIFLKGSILPLKKKIYKTASKSILKDSDSHLIINIVEGNENGLPSSGLSIGFIEISGKDLEEDLIKGTDIEIDLEISESRDLKISVYLQSTEQEFENSFSQSERTISIRKITLEINSILNEIDLEIKTSNQNENFEYSQKLEKIRTELIEISIETTLVEEEDVSDKKYQLDDKKRQLIFDYDKLTRHKHILTELTEYNDIKESIEYHLKENENERYLSKYNSLIKNEKEVINSLDKFLIRAKTKELDDLWQNIFQSNEENFIAYFLNLKFMTEFNDKRKADKLFKEGDKALDKQDYKTLRFVVYGLSALLPESNKEKKIFKDDSKTGLS